MVKTKSDPLQGMRDNFAVLGKYVKGKSPPLRLALWIIFTDPPVIPVIALGNILPPKKQKPRHSWLDPESSVRGLALPRYRYSALWARSTGFPVGQALSARAFPPPTPPAQSPHRIRALCGRSYPNTGQGLHGRSAWTQAGVERGTSSEGSNTSCSPSSQARWTPG